MTKLYTKNTWVDEVLAGNERYSILEDNGAAFKSLMQIALSTAVTQAGTLADATKMNNLENGLDAVDTLLASLADVIKILSGNVGIGTAMPKAVLHSFFNTSGGAPATSGSSDVNIGARIQNGAIALDIGAYVSGNTWIQNRSSSDYASNFPIVLNPNGGDVYTAKGTWTPTFTGLTVVGTPTYTGRWTRVGKMVWYQMTIVATTTTASIAGSTFCNNLPFTLAQNSVPTAVDSAVASLGNGFAGGTNCYLPTWSARATTITVNGFGEVA